MYNTDLIADYILYLAYLESMEINAMKLSKLIYFCNGWYLAIHAKPLIDEPILACNYGIKIESIMNEYARYGNYDILNKIYQYKEIEKASKYLDSDSKAVIDKVWDGWKKFSPIQLSNITHTIDSPWKTIWDKNIPKKTFREIPDDLIQEYFVNFSRKNKEEVHKEISECLTNMKDQKEMIQ